MATVANGNGKAVAAEEYTDRIPAWVLHHLDEVLPSDVRILNSRDLGKGRFLLNSTDGAVLVHKSIVGEPVVQHVPVPGRPSSLSCSVCRNHMVLLHPHEGQSVYCSRCGTPYRLEPHALDAIPDDRTERNAAVEISPTRPGPKGTEAYTHGEFTLHGRNVKLKAGGAQTIYFFAKKKPKSGAPCPLPDGYEVGVNKATGLPYLQKVGHKPRTYRPQCSAVTSAGKQCRNSAREGSDYCASHKGFHPPAAATARAAEDTKPRVRKAEDTPPRGRHAAHRDKTYRPQCGAVTGGGAQCRNSARRGSKYCASHKGHRPSPRPGKDTRPRVRQAEDTLPARRKS